MNPELDDIRNQVLLLTSLAYVGVWSMCLLGALWVGRKRPVPAAIVAFSMMAAIAARVTFTAMVLFNPLRGQAGPQPFAILVMTVAATGSTLGLVIAALTQRRRPEAVSQ